MKTYRKENPNKDTRIKGIEEENIRVIKILKEGSQARRKSKKKIEDMAPSMKTVDFFFSMMIQG